MDFSSLTSLSVNGAELNRLFLNGEVVYSTTPDSKIAVNEAAKSILNNAQLMGTNSYTDVTGKTYNYNVYNTFEEGGFTGGGSGNHRPIPISPHILASATHYGTLPTGAITYGGVTVTRLNWVTLRSWAETHGQTRLFHKITNGDDISICFCDKATAVPDSCLPWYMTTKTSKLKFWNGDLTGVVCWHSPQKSITVEGVAHQYAVPMIVTGVGKWGSGKDNASLTGDADIIAKFNAMGDLYKGYSGDSGKPTYIMLDNKPVIISACQSVFAGPDYIAATDLFREVVIDYEGLNLMKEVQ